MNKPTPEDIVRALAAMEDVFDANYCPLCDARLDLGHKLDCPWRQAVEWVAQSSVSEDVGCVEWVDGEARSVEILPMPGGRETHWTFETPSADRLENARAATPNAAVARLLSEGLGASRPAPTAPPQ